MLGDLGETFANLRKFRLKLNPDKCTFGVPAGKLLGFLVSSRGIEANPTKIRAIENMKLPRCLRDIQKFTGRAGGEDGEGGRERGEVAGAVKVGDAGGWCGLLGEGRKKKNE